MKNLFFGLIFAAVLNAAPALARVPIDDERVVVLIDLSAQSMLVYVNGFEQYSWAVSTARRGYYTPTGNYRPRRLERTWYSRKYDNSPMPNSIFFLGGFAVHGTGDVRNLGRPASHGCVRLHPSNARALFALVSGAGMKNTRIVIRQ